MIVEQITTVIAGYFIGARHSERYAVCDFCGAMQPSNLQTKNAEELRALGWVIGEKEHFCSFEHMSHRRELNA